jgi:hypothetical protein
MVAGIGLTGAVVAYFISREFDWRICYYIGGALGSAIDSWISVFDPRCLTVKKMNVRRGDFSMFLLIRQDSENI